MAGPDDQDNQGSQVPGAEEEPNTRLMGSELAPHGFVRVDGSKTESVSSDIHARIEDASASEVPPVLDSDLPGASGRLHRPETNPEFSADFADKINQILKFRVEVPTGQPNFAKRDELRVACDAMAELSGAAEVGEAGGGLSSVQILDAVTKAKTPTEMRVLNRNVKQGKEVIAALDAAGDYLESDFVVKIERLLAEAGSETVEDVTDDVARKQRDLERLEKRFHVLVANKQDTASVETEVGDVQKDLDKLNKQLKKYNKRKNSLEAVGKALDELFKHFEVLKKEGVLTKEQAKVVADQYAGFKNFKTGEKVDLKVLFEDLIKVFGKEVVEAIVVKIDGKHAELGRSLRANEQVVRFAQEGVEKNRDLTDHQFALKVFEYKVRNEHPEMEEEEVKKQAKKEFLEALWKLRTERSLDDVVDGAGGDLLQIMDEAMLKDRVLCFRYKAGGNVVKPFAGVDPGDLSRDKIDDFLRSGRVDLKSAFFLLAVFERREAAGTYQYNAIRKYIFGLLVDEHGLTQAQAIRAFNDKNKRVAEVMNKYETITTNRGKLDDEIMKIKVERACARVKSGEVDQVMFMYELEDAGVAKNGKVDRALLSRLGVDTNYYLNHRYWAKAGNVAANRALWLGETALLQPGLLGARWLGAEATALAWGVGAFGKRMVFNYPLSVLRAPLHIVTHPFSALFRPIKTLKAAGASVVEGIKKTEEGAKAGHEKRRAFVKGQVDKGASKFSLEAKDRIDLDKMREATASHKSMRNLSARIDSLEKKAEGTVLEVGADVDMNFEKYRKLTGTNEQETAQRQAA